VALGAAGLVAAGLVVWGLSASAKGPPLDTIIDSQPTDPTKSSAATFEFHGTGTAVSFECDLDGGGFSTCTSPVSYTELDVGNHVFSVRGLDGGSLPDPSPATHPWTVANHCHGTPATIIASPGIPVEGTANRDVILGSGEDEPDEADGNGGKDLICLGKGADVMRGDAGRDRLLGATGGDELYGNAGNDELLGGKQADKCRGGPGSDTMQNCEL
jgi:Ca2+-binding RTX toxin-like protein